MIHELCNLTLEREGRETAKLRIELLKEEFTVVPATADIAEISAEFRPKYNITMGDSMIAATASSLKALCVSDDSHFKPLRKSRPFGHYFFACPLVVSLLVSSRLQFLEEAPAGPITC